MRKNKVKVKEPSEVPGTACLILREEIKPNERETEAGNAGVGRKGRCRGGRVIPYSITPNLG